MAEKKKEVSKNIHQRINAVMADVSYIYKGKEVMTASGKVMYTVVGHDDVTKKIHPLLVKHGINIIPECVAMTQEGNRVRADMEFTWVNIDNPEDCIVKKWSAFGMDSQHDKAIGKAYSYAQRLMTLKTLHIQSGDEDCEDGAEEFKKEHKPATAAQKALKKLQKIVEDDDVPYGEVPNGNLKFISDEQRQELNSHVNEAGVPVDVISDYLRSQGWNSSKEIPADRVDGLFLKIDEMAKEALDG